MAKSLSDRQANMPGMGADVGGLLRLKADAPIKPAAPQKPCDVGLFGDPRAPDRRGDNLGQRAGGEIGGHSEGERQGKRARSQKPDAECRNDPWALWPTWTPHGIGEADGMLGTRTRL
jgi:hypothetical protein